MRRRLGPPDGQFALLGGQVDPGVEAELVVVEGLLGRVGQDGPCLGDELECLIGKRVLVLVGVEEEGEASVLLLDEILVVGSGVDLEDGVPVVVVVDAPLGGEEDVDDGQDLIRAVEEWLGLLGQHGEVFGAVQISVL
ncbi:hypothetical protein TorRG33x02_236040 [Trema orientale]|uniref:Uncharacterized protein n=1 Tax=Trema orientale TaxID=63057 RepID=A0A2P5E1B7_TREOI|nr:hypothetical protein TorRG33x02_236040 [Trema orientale]